MLPGFSVGRARGDAIRLDLAGSLAYVADERDAPEIFDVSDARDPVQVGRLAGGSRGRAVVVAGEPAFLADPERGAPVVNLANPENPAVVATIPGTSGAWALHRYEHQSSVGRHGSGITLADISEPLAPVRLGSCLDGGEAQGVRGNGRFLFVADNMDGVEVLAPDR